MLLLPGHLPGDEIGDGAVKSHHARHDGELQRRADQHQANDLGAEHDDEGYVHIAGELQRHMGPMADKHPDRFAAALEQDSHGGDLQKLDARFRYVGGDGSQQFHSNALPMLM